MALHYNFFGATNAARQGVACEASELDIDEAKRLERKYGTEAELVVDLSD